MENQDLEFIESGENEKHNGGCDMNDVDDDNVMTTNAHAENASDMHDDNNINTSSATTNVNHLQKVKIEGRLSYIPSDAEIDQFFPTFNSLMDYATRSKGSQQGAVHVFIVGTFDADALKNSIIDVTMKQMKQVQESLNGFNEMLNSINQEFVAYDTLIQDCFPQFGFPNHESIISEDLLAIMHTEPVVQQCATINHPVFGGELLQAIKFAIEARPKAACSIKEVQSQVDDKTMTMEALNSRIKDLNEFGVYFPEQHGFVRPMMLSWIGSLPPSSTSEEASKCIHQFVDAFALLNPQLTNFNVVTLHAKELTYLIVPPSSSLQEEIANIPFWIDRSKRVVAEHFQLVQNRVNTITQRTEKIFQKHKNKERIVESLITCHADGRVAKDVLYDPLAESMNPDDVEEQRLKRELIAQNPNVVDMLEDGMTPFQIRDALNTLNNAINTANINASQRDQNNNTPQQSVGDVEDAAMSTAFQSNNMLDRQNAVSLPCSSAVSQLIEEEESDVSRLHDELSQPSTKHRKTDVDFQHQLEDDARTTTTNVESVLTMGKPSNVYSLPANLKLPNPALFTTQCVQQDAFALIAYIPSPSAKSLTSTEFGVFAIIDTSNDKKDFTETIQFIQSTPIGSSIELSVIRRGEPTLLPATPYWSAINPASGKIHRHPGNSAIDQVSKP